MSTNAYRRREAMRVLELWTETERLTRLEHPEWWEVRGGRMAEAAEDIRHQIELNRKIIAEAEAAIKEGRP